MVDEPPRHRKLLRLAENLTGGHCLVTKDDCSDCGELTVDPYFGDETSCMTYLFGTRHALSRPARSPMTSTPINADQNSPFVVGTSPSPASGSPTGKASLAETFLPSLPRRSKKGRRSSDQDIESRLAMVRLGIASSLFYALRTKHSPTAAHGLRVALFCSAWADHMGLEADVRDRIEVAALLHDVGKIGVPDRVLRKVGKLNVDEQLLMDACPEMGCEILRGCTADPELLNMVRYSTTWYDSRRGGEAPRGDGLPLGSRMLSIADAFDAMTTEHVYRQAKSGERAIAELIQGSGTQFDPQLIIDFSRLLSDHPEILQGSMVHRWL